MARVLKLTFVVIAACASRRVAAQGYGVVIGADILDVTTLDHTTHPPRAVVGGFLRLIGRDGVIDLGINYAFRRIDECGVDDCGDIDRIVWSFRDIEIPLIGRGFVSLGHDVRLLPMLGIAPWINMRMREQAFEEPEHRLENFNRFDLALVLGVGADWRCGDVRLGIDLRSSIGLFARQEDYDGGRDKGITKVGYVLFTVAREH